MEQTLGKRIADHRRRMKLTQDQLAEQLGLTAQAISKWENDQSCPDIAMLPRLAEIFGVTVDQLLGCAAQETVHEAEVVDNPADIDTQYDTDKNDHKWEFHWSSSKRQSVLFALWVLLTGIAYFAARLLHYDDCSLWDMLWPSFLMVYGIDAVIRKFSVFGLGVFLFGGYSMIRHLHIWEMPAHQNAMLPLLIVLFGLGLLIDALKKPNKPHFHIKKDGHTVCGNKAGGNVHCTTDGETFECNSSFGDYSQTVSLPVLAEGEIICSFGDLTVDLSGCESLADECHLEANCSFGCITLLVPRKYRVVPETNSAFADFVMHGHPAAQPEGIIRLEANVSFGGITVRYI